MDVQLIGFALLGSALLYLSFKMKSSARWLVRFFGGFFVLTAIWFTWIVPVPFH